MWLGLSMIKLTQKKLTGSAQERHASARVAATARRKRRARRSHSTVHSHHIRLFPFLGSCVWLVVSRVDAWHFEQLYAALVLESASSGCGVSTTISTFAPAHIRLFAFSAHSARALMLQVHVWSHSREDILECSSVDMRRFEPLYTDTALVLETHLCACSSVRTENSACSSIKQQCAPLLTFPLFSVHARALASMRDVIAPLIAALVLETHLRV